MARYFGDFRSLDTSIDPKGQLYRVLIFTGFDGNVPYQYLEWPAADGYPPAVTPIVGTELTMAERPFTVEHEGDPENIFKPYRCSTASVSFMSASLPMSMLSAGGTSTLVLLLKWKNEVEVVNGHLHNTVTDDVLNKMIVTDPASHEVLFNDFEPYKYDKFCFDVEWMGYATPETFSMGYDHVKDVFTLNCQDALSTLQYRKYSAIQDSIQTLVDALIDGVSQAGYAKLYVTNSLRFAAADSVTALHETIMQTHNCYDEDGEPADKLSVIRGILQYMNLTAIPYRDGVIVTTAQAMAQRQGIYNVWSKHVSNYILPFDYSTMSQQGDEQLEDLFETTVESHSGGTTIGTTNAYNSVKVEADEYPVNTLIPDIGDNSNLTDGTFEMSHGSFILNDTEQHWTWEHEFFGSHTPKLELYQYEGSQTGPGWGTQMVETPDYTFGATTKWRPTAAVLDDGGLLQVNYTSALKKPYSPKRTIYFRTPTGFTNRGDYDDTSTYWQPLLHATTKPILVNSGYFLRIKGSWSFFSTPVDALVQVPANAFAGSNITDAQAMPQYSRIWAKVRCGDKWLANGSITYQWSDTEQVVGLMLDISDDTKAFGSSIPFAREYRNLDGIVVPLPPTGNKADFTEIEIWINRPLGVYSILCETATLTDFSFDVLTLNELKKKGGETDTNTEFKTEMNAGAISEYPAVRSTLSSETKGIRYSQTARINLAGGFHLETMGRILDSATGLYCLPERHTTSLIASQYREPAVNIGLSLHNDIKPFSRVTWAQMSGRIFIPNGMEVDYESHTCSVTASEVKPLQVPLPVTVRDTTRNHRRNGDVLYRDTLPNGNTRIID